MSTLAIRGSDDILDDVLALPEVDPLLGAELQAQLLLVRAGVCKHGKVSINITCFHRDRGNRDGRTDSDDPKASCDGVLDGYREKMGARLVNCHNPNSTT